MPIRGLEVVGRELRNRYESDYKIVCERSAATGRRTLRGLEAAGEEVAAVIIARGIGR